MVAIVEEAWGGSEEEMHFVASPMRNMNVTEPEQHVIVDVLGEHEVSVYQVVCYPYPVSFGNSCWNYASSCNVK